MYKRNKEVLGIVLALVGLLFLLVSNNLLWFGWSAVWPLFLVLTGGFLLRIFADKKNPDSLFGGLIFLFLGFFFLIFTTGIRPWNAMAALWPAIPMIAGIALLALAVMKKHATAPLVIGVVLVGLSIACFMYTAGTIGSHIAVPFIRLWPLVLIASGVLIFLRSRDGRRETDIAAVVPEAEAVQLELDTSVARDAGERGIEEVLSTANGTDQAIRGTVEWLKNNNSNYSWVGVYRREENMLVLDPHHYLGMNPEHKRIRIPEGVCGQAAEERRTIIVPDVRTDERFLACSPFTRSEIVVPIIKDGEIYGVLDIDSDDLDAFHDEDRELLEDVVAKLIARL
jgi:putative methionine-R-sulfoxide reductase with GAF domain